jgi:glucosamine--fructose-6-phosphate aminotransferase (isomerizing)
MCGIVGYVGSRAAEEILVEGLRRLEYRGYDSAGVATVTPTGEFAVTKAVGRIDNLAKRLEKTPAPGTIGIGHTRWATHGAPNDVNSHPHLGGDGSLVLCHNGVIENFRALKAKLEAEGYVFRSATDTEVIAHLIDSCLRLEKSKPANKKDKDPVDVYARAIKTALAQLHGTYGLTIMFHDVPRTIFAARLGSPLVVGVGDDEHFIASDASPLVGHTTKIVYLSDHELAVVTEDQLRIMHRDTGNVAVNVKQIEIDNTQVQLNGYEHYMLKEIYEQPETIQNAMRGRLSLDEATSVFGGLNLTASQLRNVNRIILTGCGTSWHAALVGEYLIEELARLPVEVEYASELRYRNPPVDRDTLLFAITQSGETADTLAALREMKRKGHSTLAICNTVGSTIAQEADGGIYLHAGPEIGVASTKAFTSQVVTLAMLALHLGRLRHLSFGAGQRIIDQLRRLPEHVAQALDCHEQVKRIAEKYHDCRNFLYLGRNYNFPTALEGALKLKEISYLHAEGYPAAEMKHGPIALVDEHTPSVFLMPQGFVYDKVMSNLEEIKARGGPVIAVVEENDDRVEKIADDVIRIPAVEEFLQPIVSIIPLQLLAYQIALLRGCDVDKPRNLAKSVTVE